MIRGDSIRGLLGRRDVLILGAGAFVVAAVPLAARRERLVRLAREPVAGEEHPEVERLPERVEEGARGIAGGLHPLERGPVEGGERLRERRCRLAVTRKRTRLVVLAGEAGTETPRLRGEPYVGEHRRRGREGLLTARNRLLRLRVDDDERRVREVDGEMSPLAGCQRAAEEGPAAEELDNQPRARGEQKQSPRDDEAIIEDGDVAHRLRELREFVALAGAYVADPDAEQTSPDQDGPDDVDELQDGVGHGLPNGSLVRGAVGAWVSNDCR